MSKSPRFPNAYSYVRRLCRPIWRGRRTQNIEEERDEVRKGVIVALIEQYSWSDKQFGEVGMVNNEWKARSPRCNQQVGRGEKGVCGKQSIARKL